MYLKRKCCALIIFAVLQWLVVTPSFAQEKFSFELRFGPSIPTEDLGDLVLDLGFGFETTFSYLINPAFGIYGGWGVRGFESNTLDVGQTGYAIGLQYNHNLLKNAVFRFRTGLTYEHIELLTDDGDSVDDSNHGVGYEIGAAIPIEFSDQWSFAPGIRFRSLKREIETNGVHSDVDLNYVALDVGFLRVF